jgi:hypothetical protein
LNSLRFLLVLGLMGGLGGCSLLFVAKGETRFVASRWKGEPTTVSLETQMSQPVDDCIPRTNDEEVIQYTVRQGDNLWKLSRRFYGNSRHVRSLEKDNGLGPHHAFKVGLVIKITAPTRNRENGKPVETPVPNLTQAISTPFSLADMVPLTQVPRPQVNLAFAPGEKLKFEVRVLSVLGGYATLEVGNPVNVEGRPCLPLIARANSAFPFSTFYNVNDIQTSYFDAVDFLTWKFENNVLEGNYKAHNVELYHQLQHQLVRQHNDDISVSSSIPAFTQDIISCFYYLRLLPLQMGDRFGVPTTSGGKNYQLVVNVVRREEITVPAGTFDCFRLKPVVKYETVFRNKEDIDLWVTADQRHIPVLIKSAIVVGNISIALLDATLPQIEASGQRR